MIHLIENLQKKLGEIGIHNRLMFHSGFQHPIETGHLSGVFRLKLLAQDAGHRELRKLQQEVADALKEAGYSRMMTQPIMKPFEGFEVHWGKHRENEAVHPIHLIGDAEACHFMSKNPWFKKTRLPRDAKHALAVLLTRGHLVVSANGQQVELPSRRTPSAETLEPDKLKMLDLLIERGPFLEKIVRQRVRDALKYGQRVNLGFVFDALIEGVRMGGSSGKTRPPEGALATMEQPLDFFTLKYPNLNALERSSRILEKGQMILDLSTHARTDKEMAQIQKAFEGFKKE